MGHLIPEFLVTSGIFIFPLERALIDTQLAPRFFHIQCHPQHQEALRPRLQPEVDNSLYVQVVHNLREQVLR